MSRVLAHSKGKKLGLYEEHEVAEEEREAKRQRDEEMGVRRLDAFGMKVGVGCGRAPPRLGAVAAEPPGARHSRQRKLPEREHSRRTHAVKSPARSWAARSPHLLLPQIPTVAVGGKQHAVSEGHPITPASVQQYLQRAFGGQLEAAKSAMAELAASVGGGGDLSKRAYPLYEQFCPEWRGWGQKAELRLDLIRQLAQEDRGGG